MTTPEEGEGEPTPPDGATSRAHSSLLGALTWFVASYGFAVLGYLAVNAIASRWLGVSEFGYFVIATTVSTGIGQFALLGVHRAGLRDAAAMGGRAEDEVLLELRSGARGAAGVSVPVASLLAGAVLFLVVDTEPVGERVLLALVFAGLVYLSGLQKLWANYLRGLGAVRLSSLLEGRSGGALVALAQALFLLLGWQLLDGTGLAGALLAAGLGFFLPVVGLGLVVQRRWRHLPPRGHVLGDLGRSARRNWRFAVNQAATYLGGTVEIWMAGVLLGAADTSLFSAAQRVALLIAIPLVSLQVVFAPVCARLLARGETAELERVLRTGATLAALGAAVLWIPTLVAPGQVLHLVYGEQFAAGALVLLVLSVGNAANVLSGLSGIALTMSHREGTAALITTATLTARVVLGTIAALVWGLWGLAITSAVITTVHYGLMWWQARRLIGVQTHVTLRPQLSLLRSTRG